MAKKTITVKQIRSVIGSTKEQRGTVIGLGLRKVNSTRVLEDTPSIRGMVNKVAHLVTIIEE